MQNQLELVPILIVQSTVQYDTGSYKGENEQHSDKKKSLE
jgi:hypothetical protein